MHGACLCGAVTFTMAGPTSGIYQCHCSLCRKVSGSSSNSALWAFGQFEWISGETNITRWTTPSGFQSCFCRTCGSPLPNPLRDGSGYWVPAGLLDEPEGLSVVAQVCVASRASWDNLDFPGVRLEEMIDGEAFLPLIYRAEPVD